MFARQEGGAEPADEEKRLVHEDHDEEVHALDLCIQFKVIASLTTYYQWTDPCRSACQTGCQTLAWC
jgi:hypothetical protein